MFNHTHTTQQLKLFNILYNRYAAAFYGEIKRNLHQQDVCDQTLENAFQQIWVKMADLTKNEPPPFIWCYQIARKEMIKKKVELTIKEIFACQQLENKVD